MSDDKPRKVYKRRGIVHLCYAGRFWAPSDSSETQFTAGDEVFMAESDQAIFVWGDGSTAGETWVATVIGSGPKRKARAGETPGRRDGLAIFLPHQCANRLGIANVDDTEQARELAITAVELFGIPEELWEQEGWGAVHDRFTLLPIGRVDHGGKYSARAA